MLRTLRWPHRKMLARLRKCPTPEAGLYFLYVLERDRLALPPKFQRKKTSSERVPSEVRNEKKRRLTETGHPVSVSSVSCHLLEVPKVNPGKVCPKSIASGMSP